MKFCAECGTQLEDDALFCVKCGAKQEITQSTTEELDDKPIKKKPVLLKTYQCIGATTFNLDRKLYIYDNRITLMKDNYETIFDCNYQDVKRVKNGGMLAPTFMSLVLNDGTVYKFKFNGNDFSMLKVAKELPGYIDLLKKDYLERKQI